MAGALGAMGLRPDFRDEQIFSFENGTLTIDRDWADVAGVQKDEIDLFHERYEQLDPECKAVIGRIASTKTACQRDLLKGLGNAHLSTDVASMIPGSLDTILRHTPGASGLFSGVREYESSWLSTLKNSGDGRANGIAYEVNATAALIRNPITNSNGTWLGIDGTDRIYFGVKYQSRYGSGGPLLTPDGQRTSLFQQPFRRTVEADLLIVRDTLEIGVDFKHTTYGNQSHVSKEQIEGVVVALETGEADRFYFVSNFEFTQGTVSAIRAANERLTESGNAPIQMFEFVKA